jgi:hypothetical protein
MTTKTDIQWFCLKELESMVSKEENCLSTILEKGVLDNMTLLFIPSEQLEKLTSIGCIGDIECETKPLDICFGDDIVGFRLIICLSLIDCVLHLFKLFSYHGHLFFYSLSHVLKIFL